MIEKIFTFVYASPARFIISIIGVMFLIGLAIYILGAPSEGWEVARTFEYRYARALSDIAECESLERFTLDQCIEIIR